MKDEVRTLLKLSRSISFKAQLITIVIALHAGGVFAQPAPRKPYIWPIDIAREVTSTFCDERDGHPHGGIDLSLFRKVGTVPVVSVGDGVIMRIRSSPYGYGNALYIRMDDGNVALYGHLDRFSPRIGNIANELRIKSGLSRLDHYYEDWEMTERVRAGELIGYGGKSGTAVAHLHFELRDGDEYNLNPLANGFGVEDETPPEIRAVLVVPVDPDSLVDGRNTPLRIDVKRLPLASPVRTRGRVGVSVDAVDRTKPRGRALTPYRITVTADGEPFFETRYERWGYVDRPILRVQRDADERGRRVYLRAFNPYPADIPCFSAPDAGTFERLSPGRHEIAIVAGDAAGRWARTDLPIEVEPAPDPVARPWPRGTGAFGLWNGGRVEFDGRLVIAAGGHALFEPVRFDIKTSPPPDGQRAGRCYRISDPGVFLRRALDISFRYNASAGPSRAYGVYMRHKGKMRFLGNQLDPFDGAVAGRADDFGEYCLLRDETPPDISAPKFERGRKILTISISDDLSGFDADAAAVYVNGARVLVDFSPRSGMAKIPAPKEQGEFELTVKAHDRAGNETEQTSRMTANGKSSVPARRKTGRSR